MVDPVQPAPLHPALTDCHTPLAKAAAMRAVVQSLGEAAARCRDKGRAQELETATAAREAIVMDDMLPLMVLLLSRARLRRITAHLVYAESFVFLHTPDVLKVGRRRCKLATPELESTTRFQILIVKKDYSGFNLKPP